MAAMLDGREPVDGESGHPTDQFAVGIPVARPIPQPPGAKNRRRELLLLDSSRGAVWADLRLLILALVLLELVVGMTLGRLVQVFVETVDLPEEEVAWQFSRALLLPALTIRGTVAILILAMLLRSRGQSAPTVGMSRSGFPVNMVLGLGVSLIAFGLVFTWQCLIFFFWPQLWEQMSENALRIMSMIPRQHPLESLPVALFIGVYEEILFRGFLLTRLRRGTGSWIAAVIISTTIFTLLHAQDQTPAALVGVTILALVFSLATIWRGSVVPAIVGHFLYDWSTFVYLYVVAGDTWQ